MPRSCDQNRSHAGSRLHRLPAPRRTACRLIIENLRRSWAPAALLRVGARSAVALTCLLTAVVAHASPKGPARVQILGFNDFHGQLGAGKELLEHPAGSAPVLAAYLRNAMARFAGGSVIVHAGDFVGGSPHVSSLLQDEPSIAFLGMLGNAHCRGARTIDTRCNVVGTLGNHEFDEGVPELLRLLRGGDHPRGPFLERPWRGARVPYVSANVVDTRGRPILPAYVVVHVDGVRIAVIGAALTATPRMVLAEGVRGVRFIDEAEAINRAVRAVRKRGVNAVVVTIHQGAGMIPYEGDTRPDAHLPPESDIADIVHHLDDAVDVVVTGHAHQFSNALERTPSGHTILVTQAYLAGTAFAQITLTIDRASGEVTDKHARIVPTFSDDAIEPAKDVVALVQRAEDKAHAILTEVIGQAPEGLTQTPNEAGESALGNLAADAQRRAMGASIAFVNQGALRGDLDPGPITWGEILAVHPFGYTLVTVDLTGAQLRSVLEQQFRPDPPHILQVSGLTYTWDAAQPVGKRVAGVRVGRAPLMDETVYTVAISDYLARGGAGFATFAEGKNRRIGPRDVDALRAFIATTGGRATARVEQRIVRRD